MTSSTAASDATLHRAAVGYRSTLRAQAIRAGCKITGVVALARLVSPADHGLFAMAASVTFFLVLFRDLGTGAAAIQAPELSEGQMTALLRLHVGLGVALAFATLLLAPAAAAFFQEPRVISLLALMSGSFVLIGLGSWPRTLLNRDLHFAALNRVETSGAVLGTAAMIAAGGLGAGAHAFVVFLLVSEFVMLAGAWRACRWRPASPPDWPAARRLGRTGLQLTSYSLLLFALQQADTILMGRWFGAATLGFYNRASQLLLQPALHLAAPFSQVLLSTLSRLGPGSPAFAGHFRSTTNAIAHFTLPVAVLCGLLPHEVVRIVLGAAWPAAAPLLAWLSLSAAVSFVTATVYPLCVAAGNSRRLMHLAALAVPPTLLALWLGRGYGPVGLAAGLAAANLLLLMPRVWWATRGTPVSLRDFGGALAGPLGLAAGFGIGLEAGRRLGTEADTLPRFGLALAGGVAGMAFVLLCWPRVRRELKFLLAHLPFKAAPIPSNERP